jgi:hypothetical protein
MFNMGGSSRRDVIITDLDEMKTGMAVKGRKAAIRGEQQPRH